MSIYVLCLWFSTNYFDFAPPPSASASPLDPPQLDPPSPPPFPHLMSLLSSHLSHLRYQYAKNCGHVELKNRCCEFIVWNMRVVIKSPDWINVDLDNLIEFLDYSDMVITDEFTLLKV